MASNYSMSQFNSLNANQQNEIRRIATENANDTAARDTRINDAMKLYTTPAQPPAPAQPPVPMQNHTPLEPHLNQSAKLREADLAIEAARQQTQQYDANTISDGTGNTVQLQQGAPAPATPTQYPTVQNANIDNKATQASSASTTQAPSLSASKTQQPEPPKVLTQDEVFNSVLSGTALPDNVKRSPLYREVMKRKSNVDMVNAMSAEDLVFAEKAGSISGSALNDLRLVNPAKYAQFTQVKERRTKMDQINTTTNAGFNMVSGGLNSNVSAAQQYADAVTASTKKTEEETMKKLQAMSDQFAKKGEEYERKFADVVRNDPAVKEGLANLRKNKEDLTNVDAQIAKVGADVRAELAGKGVPDSYIYAVIAQRTKDLNAQRTAAATVYNGALEMLNADLDMASGQYDAFIKGEGVAQGFAEKVYDSQERAYDKSLGFATSSAGKVFGDMQSIVQNEAEFNQKIDQQAQVASDPVLATQSMIDEFKKINVLADRSDAEIIADVKKKVASGMSIGKALSELKAGFMSKPSYANFVESNKYRAPSGTSDKPFVVSDGSAVYDPATGTFKYPGGANTIGGVRTESNTVNPSEISSFVSPRTGVGHTECGVLANDWWKSQTGTSAGIGNSYSDKVASFEKIGLSSQPEVGGLYLMDTGTATGHVGIVQQVNPDGSVVVRESNFNNDGQTKNRNIPANEVSKLMFSVAPGTKTYTSDQLSLLSSLAEKAGPSPSDRKELASQNLTWTDVAKMKDGKMPPTTAQKNSMLDLVKTIDELFNDTDGLEWNAGASSWVAGNAITGNLFGGYDWGSKLDNVKSNLTMENLGKLKGPMSDADREFIAAASTRLKAGISAEAMRKELLSTRKILADKLSKFGANPGNVGSSESAAVDKTINNSTGVGSSLQSGKGFTYDI